MRGEFWSFWQKLRVSRFHGEVGVQRGTKREAEACSPCEQLHPTASAPFSLPHCAGRQTFSSVQSLSCIQLFATLWTAAHQASLSITNSQSLRKLMSIESVMPSNHLILRCPLLLPPSIFPSIRVFSNESALHMRWPKY